MNSRAVPGAVARRGAGSGCPHRSRTTGLAARVARALGAWVALAPLAAHAADLRALNQASRAADIASGVGAGSAVPALGFAAVLQTIFGLALVLGVVFGCAWLARRFGLQPGQRNALVKTIGATSLGGKERVAVVEVGDTWLVLGTGPGNVRLLHTMPAGTLPDTVAGVADGVANGPHGSFGQRFRDALKSEVGKRFSRHGDGAQ